MYVMLAGSELVKLQIHIFHYENIFDIHILKRFFIHVYFLCLCMYVCMSICTPVYRYLQKPKENFRFPGTKVIGGCKLLSVGPGIQTWVLNH